MKIVKLLAKVLLGIVLLIFVIGVCTITKMDRTPYQDMPFYTQWKQAIGGLKIDTTRGSGELKAGWAKVNITPGKPGPMAGYGNRHGKVYEAVRDSVFIRAVVLDNGHVKAAIIAADLLIIPPTVTEKLKTMLDGTGVSPEHLYVGATHSHNSVGGWGKGVSGLFFSGTYDPQVENRLAEAIREAIKRADKDMQVVKVAYLESVDSTGIRNRLVGDTGGIDAEVRSVKFTNATGKTALLTTYGAHATILDSKNMVLSRDWPGVLVDSLERSVADFAMYMAGAVGSMGPAAEGENDDEELQNEAHSVLKSFQSLRKTEAEAANPLIQSFTIALPLRDPSPRLTKELVLRSWVFRKAFGDYPSFVRVMRIGNTLMVGLPCDFSGELTPDLDLYAKKRGLNLIVTSFNGGYLGYITHDRYFEIDKYETYTMSWFGPNNGAYFQEVIRDLIDKVAKVK